MKYQDVRASKASAFIFCLLLLSSPAMAQGSEAALLASILFTVLGIAITVLVTLIVFMINRNRIVAIVNGIAALLLIIAGIWLGSGPNGRMADDSVALCWLELPGVTDLIVLFLFLVVFPKNKAQAETVPEQGQAAPSYKRVKGVAAAFAIWLFYSLCSAFDFYRLTYSGALQPGDFSGIFQQWPLLLLLTALLLFVKHKAAGWMLLVFYVLHSLFTQISVMIRLSFFTPGIASQIPLQIKLIQLPYGLFFAAMLWLLLRPGMKQVFSIQKKTMVRTLVASALLVLMLYGISMLALYRNS